MLRLAWLTGKDADRQKILASWQPAVNPSQPTDPRLTAALEAEARVYAFENRDANTVSEQELLRAAKDAEIVALEWRREGYLATGPQWEQLAGDCHAGKEPYLKRQAGTQANANMMAIMLTHYHLQTNQRFFQAAPHPCRAASAGGTISYGPSFVPEATVIGARNYNPVRRAALDATTLGGLSAKWPWQTGSV
jgi:hypothetical protein